MADVVMPRLSASMEEGTILRWLKSDGDAVAPGDELVEIETDKATETYEADAEGVLEVVVAVGETVAVGEVIARLDGAAPAPAAAPTVAAKGETTVVEATRAQSAVARRVAESKATIPDFSVTVEVDATAALAALDGAPASLEDLVVKACGVALREQPRLNATYRDGRFEQHRRVNIGVAIHGDGALVAPTIFDADTKPVAAIAHETRALAARARAGALTAPELAGGTFTVSSLAAFGVARFDAIIAPGQAAALAVGAPGRDGRMELTLSCDHRIVFGADAARFLGRMRELLEDPAALVA